jgi:hypothetical protein
MNTVKPDLNLTQNIHLESYHLIHINILFFVK